MFLRLAFRAALMATSISSFADGLPFNQDKTHLLGKVEVLKLSAAQQVEVSRTRVLKLSKHQRARLQNLAKECPPTLQVLTNRYDDCSCGMSSIAVWFRPGEVEIPVMFLPKEPMTKEEMADFGIDVPTPPEILIDEKLHIWVKGRMVSEQALQKTLLKWKIASPSSHRRTEAGELAIVIDTPPVMAGVPEASLSELVSRIRSFTMKQKIDLFVSGFRAEGQ